MSIFLLSCKKEKYYRCECTYNHFLQDGTSYVWYIDNLFFSPYRNPATAKKDCDTNDLTYFLNGNQVVVTCEAEEHPL